MSEHRILAGRTAVVTGGSRGIGAHVAHGLAEFGARVAVLARGRDALAARAAEIGPAAVPIACDVTDEAAVRLAADAVADAFGSPPDILVNNAGIFEVAPVEETSPDLFRRTIETNLVAPFLLVRALLPAMRERGSGHIVTIGSTSDRVIHPENGAYSASKFGLRALHEVLRAELRGSGVRTTLVSPSAVDTPLWDAIDPDAGTGRFPPRDRMLHTGAVAGAVLYALTQPPTVNIDELRLSRA